MPEPSLKFLKTFHVAARYQSFKAAADELCVTASAVSHQIKALESQLGVALFERKAHSLKLTEAGAHYLNSIEPLFARMESVTQQLRQRYGRHLVRLQVPPFFASELLMPRLGCFSQAHPGIDLQISTRMALRNDLLADTDVAVVVCAAKMSGVYALPLFPQSYVPVCAPALLATQRFNHPADLAGHVLIEYDDRPDLWSQWAALYGVDLKPRQLIRLDSMAAAVHAAESGVGIALVSTPLAATRLASASLVKVLKAEMLTGERYWLVAHQDHHQRESVGALMRWLVTQFGRHSRHLANTSLQQASPDN